MPPVEDLPYSMGKLHISAHEFVALRPGEALSLMHNNLARERR